MKIFAQTVIAAVASFGIVGAAAAMPVVSQSAFAPTAEAPVIKAAVVVTRTVRRPVVRVIRRAPARVITTTRVVR